jgi:nucleoid-associated protein YgaU
MFGKVLMIAVAALVLWGVVARASTGAGQERLYVVKPHDTLWALAARTYADPRQGVWEIEKRNGLHSATIVPGQRLYIQR